MELVVSKSPKVNFGYTYRTHKLLTEKALEYVPEFFQEAERYLQQDPNKVCFDFAKLKDVLNFSEIKNQINIVEINNTDYKKIIQNLKSGFFDRLATATMLPDLLKSETGFMRNRHFYMPKDGYFKKLSYGIQTKKNNAFSAFKTHVAVARAKDTVVELGMALHFLQDATIPMHTQRARLNVFKPFPIIGKLYDLKMHSSFEEEIFEKINGLLDRYDTNIDRLSGKVSKEAPMDNLFMENIAFSTTPAIQISPKNKSSWKEIQQSIVNRAIDSTIIFFKNVTLEFKQSNELKEKNAKMLEDIRSKRYLSPAS